MYCEICGKKIVGKPMLINLKGAMLYVCKDCAEKYGKSLTFRTKENVSTTANVKRSSQKVSESDKEILSFKYIDSFGKTIKEAREKQNLTIEQLSALVGIKESTLKKIEAEKIQPSLQIMRKLEKILKIKLIEKEEDIAPSKILIKDKNSGITLGELLDTCRTGMKNDKQ